MKMTMVMISTVIGTMKMTMVMIRRVIGTLKMTIVRDTCPPCPLLYCNGGHEKTETVTMTMSMTKRRVEPPCPGQSSPMSHNDDNDYVNDKYSEMTMTKRRVDPVVSDTPVLWFICPMLGDSFFCSLRG